MKPIFYAYLIIVLVLNGCSSGKSTFERGNYYEAVITSVNRLRKNNDHKKSVETLRQAYPLAVTFYEDRAKTSLASAERFKWSEVVKSYTLINNMYDEIKRCPGALVVIPNPVNYFSKLQEARQNAAEEQYAAGILALQGNTREQAKQAYGYFKVCNDYVPGYKEVNDYLQAALMAATVKIVVEPIPVHSKTVGVSAEFFNDKISEFVHGAAINEFVKFYSRSEAQKIKLNADHIVQLQFDDFSVGQVYKHEKEIHLSKDSVVMGTYVSPAASTPTPENNNNTGNRSGLIATGARPITSTGTPAPPAQPQTPPVSTQQKTDQQRASIELMEKQKLEADKAEAERLRAQKEAADRALAAKDAEAARAAKEAADKAVADKAVADKEAAEKARIEKENADRALAEKAQAEKERAEREQAERERLAKENAAKQAAAEKEKADREKAEIEKAEKDKAEKAKTEKEKADKEKEKAQNEKSEKEKIADPSINSDDTLNVTDPVYICHIPPGNKMNARTLKINRSALKAHLGHGDMEGTCDTDNNREKSKDDLKTKPNNEKKGKGPGGSANILSPDMNVSPLTNLNMVLLASREDDPAHVLRYLSSVEIDTNKVYGTVKATFYHYTKTTTSKGTVSFKIIDAKTGALLAVEKMPGEFVWKSEWATFNGDERALSAEQLRLTKQKELPAPAPQELFIEFTRPIYDQITTKLKAFYRGY